LAHHAEGLVDPKVLILDSPEHVDSENINLKIGSLSLLFQLFSIFGQLIKSRFEKSWWAELRKPIFNLMFSESTCSGVSKIGNLYFARIFGLTSPSA
jgi:hypothetical protein